MRLTKTEIRNGQRWCKVHGCVRFARAVSEGKYKWDCRKCQQEANARHYDKYQRALDRSVYCVSHHERMKHQGRDYVCLSCYVERAAREQAERLAEKRHRIAAFEAESRDLPDRFVNPHYYDGGKHEREWRKTYAGIERDIPRLRSVAGKSTMAGFEELV